MIYSPFEFAVKLTMSVVIFLGMGKTFFFLRIFESLSPIVTMLTCVISDLKIFMLFFLILIVMFSLQISICGLGNTNVEGNFRDTFYDPHRHELEVMGYPMEEFKFIGLFAGNIISVFRAAMGDFSIISASLYMNKNENYIFWFQFTMILVFTNIIFLNFVIAEAGNSYSKVQEKLV